MLLLKLRTFIALFLVVVYFGIMAPNFLWMANLVIMVKHVAIYAFLAIGMTFVIVTGGIDLSVGSIVGLAGMVAGGLLYKGLHLPSSVSPSISICPWSSLSPCWWGSAARSAVFS